MTWTPSDSKITDFGSTWLDSMLIPETADAVLGEDDPGGSPLASIAAMGSASAQAFGYLSNNLQYIRNTFLFEDLTIDINYAADLEALNEYLDNLSYIQRDATLYINFPYSGTISSTLVSQLPIVFEDITGGGRIYVRFNDVTLIQNRSLGKILYMNNVQCEIASSGVLYIDTTVKLDDFVQINRCRAVTLYNIHVLAGAADVHNYIIQIRNYSNVTVNKVVMEGSCKVPIYAYGSSHLYLNFDFSDAVEIEESFFKALYGSQITVGTLHPNYFPPGSAAASITNPLNIDLSSTFRPNAIAGSGSGTEADPTIITLDSAYTADWLLPALGRFIKCLTNPIDYYLEINLPAGTFNDTNLSSAFEIRDKTGSGKITIKGEYEISNPSNSQTTIFDLGTNNSFLVSSVHVQTVMDSIKFEDGEFYVEHTRDSTIKGCYLVPGSVVNRNGVLVEQANVLVMDSLFGLADLYGIRALYNSSVAVYNCDDNGVSDRPDTTGHFAQLGSIIARSTSPEIEGGTGIDQESSGGKVFSS